MYDQAYTALLEDLAERGMLENTMVCNLAEFGRTPRVNPAGGRDHWPQCWTVYFAGGGVQGGRVVGKSDRVGGVPAERPVDPPKSWPRFTTAWDSTWKRSCPVHKAGRSRWSTPANTRYTSCFSRGRCLFGNCREERRESSVKTSHLGWNARAFGY